MGFDMKQLFLIRHAKSSWDHPDLDDYQRPLNKRGNKDAPEMAKRLKKAGIFPELIISSPALRAFTTAKIFSAVLDYSEYDIVLKDQLYEAGIRDIEEVVKSISDEYSKVFIVGHNPGLTLFNNEICDLKLENIPTCGISAVYFNLTEWRKVSAEAGRSLFYDYPKRI